MSNWNLPAKGGHMEAQDGIYYQNMTTKMVEERLKKNDVLLLPIGSTENHGPSAPYGEDGSYRSVADIVSPDSLAKVREHKKAMKAAAKAPK